MPRWLAALLRRAPWLRFVPIVLAVLALVVALLVGGVAALIVGGAIAVVGVALWLFLTYAVARLRRADPLYEAGQTVDGVADLPTSPDFALSRPGDDVAPAPGATDNVEATRFKAALTDGARLRSAAQRAAVEPARDGLDLTALAATVVNGLDPDVTVPRRVLHGIALPERFATMVADGLREAMAYPVFDMPMYRPLVDISSELFLPNLNLIEPDSITLLETNQRFIEAYMTGLNHELARELLWREYPTDQRGSPFRQFWDVSTFLDDGEDPELRERLRDIPPLHEWHPRSDLGDHDHRQAGGSGRDEVVLTIRGELLKKYPNAVIYAHRARWQLNPDGTIDRSQERALVDIADPAAPSPDEARTPLYEARVDPDLAFFGFDLTAEEAKGETAARPDDPGWFFVIKERPGEPRFGFDIARSGALEVWNDLAWPDVLPTGELVNVGADNPVVHTRQPDRAGEGDPARRRRASELGPRHDGRRRRLRHVPGAGAGRRARRRDADAEDCRRCRTSAPVGRNCGPRVWPPTTRAPTCWPRATTRDAHAPTRSASRASRRTTTSWPRPRGELEAPKSAWPRRASTCRRPCRRQGAPSNRFAPLADPRDARRGAGRPRSRVAAPRAHRDALGRRRAAGAGVPRRLHGRHLRTRALRERVRGRRALLGRRVEGGRRRGGSARRVARARGQRRIGTRRASSSAATRR